VNVLGDLEGIIDRRLLVNFRVDPEVAARVVPQPFRVDTAHGVAIAGICLIRLTELRPRGLPRAFGVSSESAAHRFAVEWDADDNNGDAGHGVYIPCRQTDSRLGVLLGGRLFPGDHSRARFELGEGDGRHDIAFATTDGTNRVAIRAHGANELPSGSIFRDLDHASEFFRRDTVGYSETRAPGCYDGIELEVERWDIDPLAVDHISSTFFDDTTRFPPGSVEFDCALSMRHTRARWRSRPQLRFVSRARPTPHR
jgi:uncharacterized protein YqjF (DUF2071 family)